MRKCGKGLGSLPQRRLLASAVASASLVFGFTQSAIAADTSSVTLEPMEVVQKLNSYGVERTRTATKTDTPLRNVPQSISVVTDTQIRDQSMQGMADVVRYVPGVQMAQGEGHRDAPILRGNATTADFFVDGMRDDVQYLRDLYNVERVEVLKGPNGMIFGRGGSGGLINRVTKQANWTDGREVGLTYGSWENRRMTGDFNQAVNERLALRLTALFEDSNSFRDHGELERWAINPTASFALSDATLIEVGYEHFEDDRTVDRGLPSFTASGRSRGEPLKVNESTHFGSPDDSFSTAEVDALNARISHEFANGVQLSNQTRYADYAKFYQNLYPSAAYNAATNQVQLGAYNNATDRINLINQTDLTIAGHALGFDHTLLVGAELSRQVTENFRETGYFNAAGTQKNTFVTPQDSIYQGPVVFSHSATDADNESVADNTALYVQDQIQLTQHWELLLGVRYDNFKVDVDDYKGGVHTQLASSDDLFSPRAGLIYKPLDNLSFYTSYSIAYVPRAGEQLASLTASNRSLDPEEFTNREIGVKWDIHPRLAATAALYNLERTNVATADPSDPTRSILVDGQRVRGVELSLTGNLTDAWQITGGYAYQNSEMQTPGFEGNEIAQVPRDSFSLWNRYDLNSQWGLGLGAIYQSDVFAAADNKVVLPSFTRFDAAVYYTVSPELRLQLNVENLLNEEYYASAHGNNNIMPGSPLAVGLSANVSF
ncbi:TonB-dependent receptor [Pseudomonas benzenivorans]|uniref:TonB-dependent siderophore receptor n=1 Tax=Pseudomonas benzenivorans TaxID=556533 RepID=A0ABY5H4L8_9PSED|nr:TonB-dependent siderophore receptor [Pseudomonas benzenivorans]UTW06731.1 TonB-dependent siderophore receptor [Pseudomonas benzenivorans]